MSFLKEKIKNSLSKRVPTNTLNTSAYDSSISLNLGDVRSQFSGGKWVSDTNISASTLRDIQELQSSILKLNDENNLLKIKNEVLIQMILEGSHVELEN